MNRIQYWLLLAVLLMGASSNMARAITVTANPTTCVSDATVGTLAWTTPANALTSNNTYTTAGPTSATSATYLTNYLKCTGYNFNLPAGATINGITVKIERKLSSVTSTSGKDNDVKLVNAAGTVVGTNHATTTAYTTTDVVEAHGTAVDTWSAGLTVTDINSTNFGAVYSGGITKTTTSTTRKINVDQITVTIDYSYVYPPGTYSVTANPGTCANNTTVGTRAWTPSPTTNVSASDNVYATATGTSFNGTQLTQYLKCSSYGFSIPTGATINGIIVNLERKISSVTSTTGKDNDMKLVNAANAFVGTNHATTTAYTTADVTEAHGTIADTWGAGLTVTDINSVNFGAVYSGNIITTTKTARSITVDYMPITVNFTVAPSMLAEYRMDESMWNGTAGQVLDSGTNSYHATAINGAVTAHVTPAKSGSPGTCGYGVFDGINDYVALPAGFPNMLSDFTVTAWIRTTDNTKANQRIFLDNVNGTGYGLSLGDGGTGKLRFFAHLPGLSNFDSSYVLGNNTWYFVAAMVDTIAKKRTIYVYDSAGTLLNTATEAVAYSGTWGSDSGITAIGGEANATTNRFVGNLDEVRVHQGTLTTGVITTLLNTTRTCTVWIDHVVVSASSAGSTCAATNVTITPHDASHATLTSWGGTINLTTSDNKGDWALVTGTGTLNNGTANDGAATYTFPAGETSVVLGLTHTTAATVTVGVVDNATLTSLTTNTPVAELANSISFAAGGFVVTDSSGTPLAAMPNQTAGQTSTTLYLKASNTSCSGTFSGAKNIDIAFECNNPTSCITASKVVINATTLNAGAPNGSVSPLANGYYKAVSLTFNASSIAPFTLAYPDVGLINLYFRYTPSNMETESASFVVKPGGFVLSAIMQSALPNLANPGASSAADAKFVKAGEAFSVTVTATTTGGVATPNFGNETTPESVKLTNTLIAPAGGKNPAVSGTFSGFSGGAATADFSWNEVGILTLTPSVKDADYLGAGDTAGTVSGNVGRFYPDHFSVAPDTFDNRADWCNHGVLVSDGSACVSPDFTYMGEALNANFTLTAQNLGNTTTQNYTGAFAKLNPLATATALNLAAVDSVVPTDLTLRTDTSLVTTGSGSFSDGTATVSVPIAITRGASADGPYTAVDVGIAPVDSDGVMTAFDLDVDGNAINDHTQVNNASTAVRYGRSRLAGAYGSELLPLSLPLAVEYWDDGTSMYVTSVDDDISLVTAALANYLTNLNSGETLLTQPVIATGIGNIGLSAPGSGNNGSVDVTVASPTYLPSNTARATFGVYGGTSIFVKQGRHGR